MVRGRDHSFETAELHGLACATACGRWNPSLLSTLDAGENQLDAVAIGSNADRHRGFEILKQPRCGKPSILWSDGNKMDCWVGG